MPSRLHSRREVQGVILAHVLVKVSGVATHEWRLRSGALSIGDVFDIGWLPVSGGLS